MTRTNRQNGLPLVVSILFCKTILVSVGAVAFGGQATTRMQSDSVQQFQVEGDEFGSPKKKRMSPNSIPNEQQMGKTENSLGSIRSRLEIEVDFGWVHARVPRLDESVWTCGPHCLDTSNPVGLKIVNSFVEFDPVAKEVANVVRYLAGSREVQQIAQEMVERLNWVKQKSQSNRGSDDLRVEDLSLVGRLKCFRNTGLSNPWVRDLPCKMLRLTFGVSDDRLKGEFKELKRFAQIPFEFSIGVSAGYFKSKRADVPITLVTMEFPYLRGVAAKDLVQGNYPNLPEDECSWEDRAFFTRLALEDGISAKSVQNFFDVPRSRRKYLFDPSNSFLIFGLERYLSLEKGPRNYIKTRIRKAIDCLAFIDRAHSLLIAVEAFNADVSRQYSIKAKGLPFEPRDYFVRNLGLINKALKSELSKR